MSDETATPQAPQEIAVKNPAGEVVTIPADRAQEAIQSGKYSYATPEEYQAQAHRNSLQTVGKGAEAFGLGLAHGAIPGAPAAIEALGGPAEAEQKEIAEARPGLYGTGKVGGAGLQFAGVSALTGGLGAAGEAASLGEKAVEAGAEGAELLSPAEKVAQAVAEGGEPAAAAEAAGSTPAAINEAANAGAKKAAGYISNAAAGAVGNASDYINESELGDHEFNGEQMALQAGIGSLFGVAGEGAINLLKDTVAPPVIKKAGEALEGLKSKLGDVFDKVVAKANSINPEEVTAARQAIMGGAKKAGDAEIDSLAKGIDEVQDKLNEADRAHFEDHSKAEAKANLADVAPEDVRAHLEQSSQALGDRVADIQKDLDTRAGRNASVARAGKAMDEVNGALGEWQRAIKAPDASAFELHQATLDLRRNVDKAMKWGADLEGDDRDLISRMRQEIRTPLKQILSNETFFGAEQAGRNASVNEAASQFYTAKDNLFRDLGQKELGAAGAKEVSVSPAKLRSVMNGDPLAAQMKLRHVQEYEQAAQNYLKQLSTSAANAGAEVPGGADLEAMLHSVSAQRAQASAYQPVTTLLKSLRQQPPWGLGAGGAAPLAGVAAHMLGIPGAAVAPIVAGVAALRSPVKAMQMFARVSGTAAAAKDLVGAGVEKIFGSPTGRAAVLGAAREGMKGFADSKSFEKQSQQIQALASDPNSAQTLNENVGRLASVAPNTAKEAVADAQRCIAVLNDACPKNPAPSTLPAENKAWKPGKMELFTWDNVHEAVLDPPRYLQKLAAGQGTPEAWEALQKAHPKWTAQVQQATMEHLVNNPGKKFTQAQKYTASMILGRPISPTVDGQLVAQTTPPPAAPQTPMQGPKKRSPTQHGLDKINIASRTGLVDVDKGKS